MTDKNPSNFGDMMIKYFCANCERLKLAESRFRAGEEYNKTLKLVGQKKNEREIYLKWQQAIADYEAAVKGEC